MEFSAREEMEKIFFFFFLEDFLKMRSKKVHFSGPIRIEKVSETVLHTTILKSMHLTKWI